MKDTGKPILVYGFSVGGFGTEYLRRLRRKKVLRGIKIVLRLCYDDDIKIRHSSVKVTYCIDTMYDKRTNLPAA